MSPPSNSRSFCTAIVLISFISCWIVRRKVQMVCFCSWFCVSDSCNLSSKRWICSCKLRTSFSFWRRTQFCTCVIRFMTESIVCGCCRIKACIFAECARWICRRRSSSSHVSVGFSPSSADMRCNCWTTAANDLRCRIPEDFSSEKQTRQDMTLLCARDKTGQFGCRTQVPAGVTPSASWSTGAARFISSSSLLSAGSYSWAILNRWLGPKTRSNKGNRKVESDKWPQNPNPKARRQDNESIQNL